MPVAQRLLDGALSHSRARSRAWTLVRNALVKRHDPVVRYQITNKQSLALPLSHQLPFYRRDYPLYSDNLRRLACFLRSSYGQLRMIDVGANVGDSYFLTEPTPRDCYLLVEGDPAFYRLLVSNTEGAANVICEMVLLSDVSSQSRNLVVSSHDGSARVTADDHGAADLGTLDDLLDGLPAFPAPNLIKTDVEGYDSKVLSGAHALLAAHHPVVFFEHSPAELRRVGDDDQRIFHDLARWGYDQLILYDNLGYLLAIISPGDTPILSDLTAYIRQRDVYVDVCAFHRQDADRCSSFVGEERRFYERRCHER